MAKLKYPARVDVRGKYLVATFLDIPEAVTQSESSDELVRLCTTVLERMLGDCMRKKRGIPTPSAASGANVLHISLSPSFEKIIEQYIIDRQGHISTAQG
jgi:hypothetical protein